jgi:hypothetical protein
MRVQIGTSRTAWMILAVLQPANQAVDVAKHKKVPYLGTFEGEDRHAGPPNVPAAGGHFKQFLSVKTVKPHLSADAIAFLNHREDVRRVLAERPCDEIDVAGKLFVPDQRRSKRATESEPFVENDRYQALVGVVPQFLVEHANRLFLW